MKLFYFDVRGRAETSRLLLRLSETKFEDVKISAEDWGLKMKDAPWLELDDGRLMTQSFAIAVFCAEKAQMLPSDPLQLARTIELANTFEDMWQPIAATRILGDQEGVAAREALLEPEGEVTKKMRVMETLVTARTTAFYCGDDVSLADIHLFCVLGFLRSGFTTGITAEFTDQFEGCSALRSKVASLPKVEAMYVGVPGFEP